MMSKGLCFECNRPEGDHPLMILSKAEMAYGYSSEDGHILVRDGEARVILSGRSWKYEYCSEFVGEKQLSLW